MTWLVRAVCAAAAIATALPAYAQSLGDVARQEEARRASAAKAVKTLSNADLGPSDITPPAGAPVVESCYMSKSKGRCVSQEELISISSTGVVTKANASFEPNWRSEAQSIRLQLEGARHGVTVLEATAADEERSAGERKAAEKALAAAQRSVAHYERQWEKLEQAAANQHIPRAWIEPIPTLTTRNQQ
jgi:hypothetical protein